MFQVHEKLREIWFGVHSHHDPKFPVRFTSLWWIFGLLLLLILRLQLPFHETDVLEVHQSIVQALYEGRPWGRQALVGSLEFPLLPTASLIFARYFLEWLPLSSDHVLIALVQILAFAYIIRMPQRFSLRIAVGLLSCSFLLAPGVRSAVFSVDPNWITALPSAAIIFHVFRWHSNKQLRDLILVGLNCAVLVFAGIAAIALAVAFLLTLSLQLRQARRLENIETAGMHFLLWSPSVYSLILLFLANWLVVRDPLLPLEPLVQAVEFFSTADWKTAFEEKLLLTPWLALGGLLISCLYHNNLALRKGIQCLFCAVCVLIATQTVFEAADFYTGSGTFLLLETGCIAIMCVVYSPPFLDTNIFRPFLALLIIAAALLSSIYLPRFNHGELSRQFGTPPPSEEVLQLVNNYWPRGRVFVPGLRAPAYYLQQNPERYVLRIHFLPGYFTWMARREQFNLLIPPTEGAFHTTRNSSLSRLHTKGTSWLILEKEWKDGWQLWRCIIPPENP